VGWEKRKRGEQQNSDGGREEGSVELHIYVFPKIYARITESREIPVLRGWI